MNTNMSISGRVSHITYYKKETGYGVIIITLNHEDYLNLHQKYNFVSNKLTVVGTFDRQPFIEEEYSFTGEFTTNTNYGFQFKSISFRRLSINNNESLIQYLSSDLFPGVGIKTAKLIVEELGSQTIDKIKKNKNVLNNIKGINKKTANIIYETIINNEKNQESFLFFIEHGLSLDLAKKIIDLFKSEAVAIVKENPYILMDKIEYFGFLKNDKFAKSIGIEDHNKIRLNAVIKYILKDAIYATGHSYINQLELFTLINNFLKDNPIDRALYDELITGLVNNKLIISIDNNLFDYDLYYKETSLAKIISDKLINSQPLFSNQLIDEAYFKTSQNINITLNKEQELAVKNAFKNSLLIITGGPGTGKSTIVKVILDMFVKLNNDNPNALLNVALLAPTGKASKRLIEITNVEAQTIHKYLGYDGEHFEFHKNNKKDSSFIIIDEASMMDLSLAYQLFSAVSSDARIIIVGDVNQLPSVGPGQVLKDLIDTKEIETIRLTKIHRQAQDSKIIQLAHNINEGILPDDFLEKYPDRICIPTASDNITNLCISWIKEAINKGKKIDKDIQVLAPMYRVSGGINELNQGIQAFVNPKKLEEIHFQNQYFRVNDKVIQLINRAEKKVMNGDIGIIDSFSYKNGLIQGLVVEYDFGKVSYTLDELDELSLAYAISVHKSQGSEFDIVIVPLSTSYTYMFKRKLIYTAITRAKKMLVLIGDVKVLQRGITFIEKARLTILKDLIISNLKNIPTKLSIYDFEDKDIKIEERKKDNISPYDFVSIIGEEEMDI